MFVALLLSRFFCISVSSLFTEAIEANDFQKVKLLVQNGHDINGFFEKSAKSTMVDYAEGDTPLTFASKQGKLEMVEVLISMNAEVNKMNRWNDTPLEKACAFENTDVVKVLLKNNADVNKSYRNRFVGSPVFFAFLKKNYELADLLIHSGAKLSQRSIEMSKKMYSTDFQFLEFLEKNVAP